eukprot:SAG22_NODE_530_length_9427_cov_3.306818_10_plen_79_part_00
MGKGLRTQGAPQVAHAVRTLVRNVFTQWEKHLHSCSQSRRTPIERARQMAPGCVHGRFYSRYLPQRNQVLLLDIVLRR